MKSIKNLPILNNENLKLKSASRLSFVILLIFNSFLNAQTQSNYEKFDRMLFAENYETAISIMDSILRIEPENAEAHYKIALAYQNIYRHDKAIDHLKKAKSLAENDIRIISALGKSYFTLGSYDKAQEIYVSVLSKDPSNLNIAFNLARVFVEQNLYNKAIELYQKLVLKDSVNSYIYKQLGYCYLKTEELETSTLSYETAYALNPSDINVVLQLAVNYIKLDQLENASELVYKYQNLYPDDARFIRLKGDILYKQKYYKDADTCYLKVISLGDSSSYVYQKSGLCSYYYALNNDSLNANQKLIFFERSVSALEKAAEKDSSSPAIFMFLSLAYYKSGRFQDAIEAMKGAKNLCISELVPDICSYLGDYHKVVKQYNEALDEYKEALHYKPDSRDLLISIGDLYFRHFKDDSSALPYFEQYLKTYDKYGSSLLNKPTEYLVVESIVKQIRKNIYVKKNDSHKNENKVMDKK